jgi:cell division septal protein FtsQ
VREQVITPRGGRIGTKPRAGASVQRPTPRRTRSAAQKAAGQKGFEWKSVLSYAPIALKCLLAICLGLVAYVGYRTAVAATFFKVRDVDVEGASKASRDDIRATVLRLSQAGVWQSDLDAISSELKNLPWVREAVVTRVLPGGLRVRVTEREPRIIARASTGRLVWADDDGVALGAASPGDQDFFVRGLEEGRGPDAVKHNRVRVSLARELARDWAQAGLSSRVSEVNLEDLEDVRVQLAGDDASIEVRLGREDYAKRLRQALEVLDAQRGTARAPFITYIDVSQGKRAVIGTGGGAHSQAAGADSAAPAPQPASTVGEAKKKDEKRDAKKAATRAATPKQAEAAHTPDVATRPRRVE